MAQVTIERQGIVRIVEKAIFEKKFKAQGFEIVEPKAKPEPKTEPKK